MSCNQFWNKGSCGTGTLGWSVYNLMSDWLFGDGEGGRRTLPTQSGPVREQTQLHPLQWSLPTSLKSSIWNRSFENIRLKTLGQHILTARHISCESWASSHFNVSYLLMNSFSPANNWGLRSSSAREKMRCSSLPAYSGSSPEYK